MFEGLRLQHWRTQVRADGIVVLTLDRADQNVNALSRGVLDELAALVERLAIEKPKGVVFISGKKAGFIPGADIKGFEAIHARGETFDCKSSFSPVRGSQRSTTSGLLASRSIC